MKIKNVIILTLISSYVFSPISAEASEVPKFIEVGKTYIQGLPSSRFIVLEIDPSGWIKVRLSDKSIAWYNVNEIIFLKEYKSE